MSVIAQLNDTQNHTNAVIFKIKLFLRNNNLYFYPRSIKQLLLSILYILAFILIKCVLIYKNRYTVN